MAVVNTKSTIVSNIDALPPVMTKNRVSEGKTHEQVAVVEVAEADEDTSVYRMLRVQSTWRISSLEVFNDAITGGTDFDIGVYETAANGGAAVDADEFADGLTMATARKTTPLDVTFSVHDIADAEKDLWELLGLSEDPQRDYDIALTGNTVGTAAGTVTLRCRYLRGD